MTVQNAATPTAPAQPTPQAGAPASASPGKPATAPAPSAQPPAASPSAAAPTSTPPAGTAPEGGQPTTPAAGEGTAQGAQAGQEAKYDLKVPEGSLLDAQAEVARVVEFAKSRGLTPEAAQEVLEERHQAVQAYVERSQKIVDGWADELKTDPEVGGDKLPGALEDAKRFIDKFADPEFKKWLNDTGFGNSRWLVRMLARAGKPLQDDRFVSGQAAAAPEIKDPRERLKRIYEAENPKR